MKYLEFREAFKNYPLFSVSEVKKFFPDYDPRRLVEWQKKGYLIKVRRGYYKLSDREVNEDYLFFAANSLYNPSYISLESALSFYGFIPEGVFTLTSVTTRNTAQFESTLSFFDYKHIKTDLFFGYRLINNQGLVYKIAEPEKALLDFFYFKKIRSEMDLGELRMNCQAIDSLIDFNKMGRYQEVFNSKEIDRKIRLLKESCHA